jgi:hypothetical protein
MNKSLLTLCKSVSVVLMVFSFYISYTYAQVTPQYFKSGQTASNSFPLASATNKVQWIYYPSNFPTSPRGKIHKIYFRTGVSTTSPSVFTNLVVKMGYTTLTSHTTGPFITNGMVTCLNAPSYSIPAPGLGNWFAIELTDPFIFDPTQNFIVEVSQGGYINGLGVYQMAEPGNRRLYGTGSSGTAGAGGLADFGFDLCSLAFNDAGVFSIDSPKTFCTGTKNVAATIRNSGINQINTLTVNWSVDGVAQTPYNFVGTLDTIGGAGQTNAQVILGSVNFPQGVNKIIKVWTSAPNGGVDTLAFNDTLIRNIQPALTGTYTVGSAPGRNYPNVAQAANDLSNFGVCGPVILNVDSGTYTGKVNFENVTGLSDINTLTLNGNKATITHTSDALDPTAFVLQMRGVKYMTVDNLTIELNSASVKGNVISMGEAEHCIIRNCKLKGDLLNTSTTYGGVVISGSSLSYSVPTNAKYNLIENNDIVGGYFGVSLYGVTTATGNIKGNIIRNNKVRDNYIYGIYNYAADSTHIDSNDIHRLNRNNISTGYGIYLSGNSQSTTIEKNTIHDFYKQVPGTTNTSYGIMVSSNDAQAGKETIIKNNLIYRIETEAGNYAIYNSGSDRVLCYYNTVYMNMPNAVAGLAYGIYQTTAATGLEFKNNNIYIKKGGSGVKSCIYLATTTAPIVSNYNNLYVDTSAAGTGAENVGNWGTAAGGNSPTLTAWQLQNTSAFDANSVSVDPLFISPPNNYFRPNSQFLDNVGVIIPSIGIDITGAVRSSTPDIGAYEFSPVMDDAGILEIVSPNGVCVGLNDVKIKVKNSGAGSLGSFNINWSINGVLQTPVPYSGSLSSGDEVLITVGSVNFTANTTYNFKLWTSNPNGNADGNVFNDTLSKNNVRIGLSGTYTVGGVGADFSSLSSIAAELNWNGVCGPVIVNVNAAAGPYTEQIAFGEIPGVSATNTIVINGNGATIQYHSINASFKSVLKLGANSKYMTIDSFVVRALAKGSTTGAQGWGIEIGSNSSYNTIKNCKIYVDDSLASTNFIPVVFSGSSSAYSIAGSFKFNKVENCLLNGGYFGITLYGVSGNPSLCYGNEFKNNTITNQAYYGLYVYYHGDSLQITGNEIHRMNRLYNVYTFYGINIYNNATPIGKAVIANNKIHDPFARVETQNSYAAYGIYMYYMDAPVGRENLVYNNTLYNFNTEGAIYGMYHYDGNGCHFYHNSLSFDQTYSASAAVTYAFYQSVLSTNVAYKNNVVSLTRGGSGAKYGMYFATNTSVITSDYNNIYVTPGAYVGLWNALSYPTLTGWRSANPTLPFDANSLSVDPMFNSNKVLIPKTGSPLTAAGTALLEVTTDQLNNVRSTSTPFIGAFETSGDFGGPSISYQPIPNTLSTTNYILNNFATITDPAGIDTAVLERPRLYYKKSTNTNTFIDNTNATEGWKYVTATNTSSPYNFEIDYSKLNGAAPVVGNVIQYFVVAQDTNGYVSYKQVSPYNEFTNVALTTDNFPVGSTYSYRIGNAISGNIEVGVGKTYTSLTKDNGAFKYINDNIASGDLNIIIFSNLSEDGAHALNQLSETGAGNYKVSIKSNADTVRNITGTYNGGLIRLNGTDRVMIDGSGSNNGKYLKFVNTSTVSNIATFQLISNGVNAGANNITIRNSVISTGTPGSATVLNYGIYAGSQYISDGGSGSDFDNILIENDSIVKAHSAIYISGTDPGTNNNVRILNNIIGSNNNGENLGYAGIQLGYTTNSLIKGNKIMNAVASGTTFTDFNNPKGIYLTTGVTNSRVTQNKINNIKYMGASGYGARGIHINTGNVNSNDTIDNNFISNILGDGWDLGNGSRDLIAGIMLQGGNTGGVKIYYNSVRLTGNANNNDAGINHISAALFVDTTVTGLDIKNNSFSNGIVNTANPLAKAYAWYSREGSVSYGDFNYNNYFVLGSQGILGFLGSDLTSIANIQSATLKNGNSISGNPFYMASDDLHAQGPTLYQKGNPVAGITYDIDNDVRAILPSIGADEYTPAAAELSAISIVSPLSGNCGITADSVRVAISNYGTASQTLFNVKVEITGAVTATMSKTYSKTILPGGTDTVSIGYFNSNVSGIITIKAYTELGTDLNHENDTVSANREIFLVPAVPSLVHVGSACTGSGAVVVASSPAVNINWYDAPVGGNLLTNNDTLITPPITGPTTYYVESSNNSIQKFSVGPVNTAIGSGGATAPTFYQVYFTVNSPISLDTICVFPSASGTVIINIKDASNTTTLFTKTTSVVLNFPGEKIKIPLGFNIPSGSYRIDGFGTGVVSLFRNTAGAVFPYTSPGGALSITGHTFTTQTYYYYFYDWKISQGVPGCASARIPVNVNTTPLPAGSGYAAGLPFNGGLKSGTLADPDMVCVQDTLTYLIQPPTGQTTGDLGTGWFINSISLKTENDSLPDGTFSSNGSEVRYVSAASDLDSVFILTANVKLQSTGCDTLIQRYIYVSPAPTVDLGADTVLCDGEILTLIAPLSESYLWSTGATTQSIQVISGGNYAVTIANGAGCTAFDVIQATFNPSPSVNLGVDTTVCGDMILDAGNPGLNYLWNTGATTQTISVSTTGTYSVKVTGIGTNACFRFDTIVVTVNASPVVDLGPPTMDICESSPEILDAGNPGANYLWSTGATTQTIEVSLAGTYSVIVTNTNGCKGMDTVVVSNKPAPDANFTFSTNALQANFTVPTQMGVAYSWNFGDNATSTQPNPAHAYTAAGTYTVTLTVTNISTGCKSTIIQTVTVSLPIGINTIANEFNLLAKPNPFAEMTKIEFELMKESEVTLEIYDLIGKKVGVLVDHQRLSGSQSHSWMIDTHSTGVYVARLTVDGKTSILRLSNVR